jgi:hypothetical protein
MKALCLPGFVIPPRRARLLAALLSLSFYALPALAKDLRRDVAEPTAVAFSASNATEAPIACTAELAHWFSADLGEALPGDAVRATLWFDAQTGEIFLRNAAGDRMPVQALWCGLASARFATRSVIRLSRQAGVTPPPISIVCTPHQARLVCR